VAILNFKSQPSDNGHANGLHKLKEAVVRKYPGNLYVTVFKRDQDVVLKYGITYTKNGIALAGRADRLMRTWDIYGDIEEFYNEFLADHFWVIEER
jgi:hypothetical protein